MLKLIILLFKCVDENRKLVELSETYILLAVILGLKHRVFGVSVAK